MDEELAAERRANRAHAALSWVIMIAVIVGVVLIGNWVIGLGDDNPGTPNTPACRAAATSYYAADACADTGP